MKKSELFKTGYVTVLFMNSLNVDERTCKVKFADEKNLNADKKHYNKCIGFGGIENQTSSKSKNGLLKDDMNKNSFFNNRIKEKRSN